MIDEGGKAFVRGPPHRVHVQCHDRDYLYNTCNIKPEYTFNYIVWRGAPQQNVEVCFMGSFRFTFIHPFCFLATALSEKAILFRFIRTPQVFI